MFKMSQFDRYKTKIIYNNDKINLFADKIIMNLSSKDVEIFMNDVNKKVLIEGTR